MDITVYPGKLSGTIPAIPSKSQAHRVLICAAFSDGPTTIYCRETNQDIEATARCLRALGADIQRTDVGYHVIPVKTLPQTATLDCGESGSTLRFMLPVAAALGVQTTFIMYGRLPYRPLSPLWEELERMGCRLTRPAENTIHCIGKLHSGAYSIDGSVSSQFITGLLFAIALIPCASTLEITGNIESAPYVHMTQDVLRTFGNHAPFHTPGVVHIEGDWSNAAFFLSANTLGSKITLSGLNERSPQGDCAVVNILKSFETHQSVDASDIPDLVPILAVAASYCHGAKFTNVRRLRLKESDRVQSTANLLQNLGAEVLISHNELEVKPAVFHSGTVDSVGDHRIAMAAAVAATVATGPVTILGAECVAKSYPGFWDDFRKLGGNYEQYIR